MFSSYVVNVGSDNVIYVRKLRALSGMIHSALLYCTKLRSDVERSEFIVNDCNLYAANQIIKGKQHTTACQLDNVKSSHQDPKVDAFISYRCRRCMTIQKVHSAQVKVTRGNT